MDERDYSAADLAARSGIRVENILKYMGGKVEKPRGDAIDVLARALSIDPIWLERGIALAKAEVPLVGYMEVGAEVIELAQGESTSPRGVEAPPDGVDVTAAIEVRGDGMYPAYSDGDVIYYTAPVPLDECLGKQCVVKLTDGRMLVKRVDQGGTPHRLTLTSYNAPPIIDADVEWIARVAWVKKI